MIKDVIFNGDVGRIEGKYYQSEDKDSPIALVMHPHPLHGGTMNNKVVYNIFYEFVKQNFSVLRFNFRGVGKSAGVFDHGIGELLDAAVALDWLQSNNPEASNCWISGFSFGAWIALQLLMRRPEIVGVVAVSPPVNLYDLSFLTPFPAQGLIIHGAKDTITQEESVYQLYEKISKQRNSDVEYMPIEDAGHFYEGKMDEFKSVLSHYLENRVIREYYPKKTKRDRRRKHNANMQGEDD